MHDESSWSSSSTALRTPCAQCGSRTARCRRWPCCSGGRCRSSGSWQHALEIWKIGVGTEDSVHGAVNGQGAAASELSTGRLIQRGYVPCVRGRERLRVGLDVGVNPGLRDVRRWSARHSRRTLGGHTYAPKSPRHWGSALAGTECPERSTAARTRRSMQTKRSRRHVQTWYHTS